MRKLISLLLALMLLFGMCAVAQTYTLTCVDCTVNGLTSFTFEGETVYTAIAMPEEGETHTGWMINGEVVNGETNPYLVFTAKGETVVTAVMNGGTEQAETEAAAAGVKVRAVGCTLQYLNADGKGEGASYTELDFSSAYTNPVTGKAGEAGKGEFKVTADNPHQSAIAYWVINGVRYDFNNTVKFITVTELTYDMTIECVYKNSASETLSGEAGTGDNLVVSCENARMRHIKGTSTEGGSYFTEFDFGKDYVNTADNKTVAGGKVTVKVIASGTGKVQYWEFNKAKLVFSSEITHFIVRDLNAKMHYVPHFNGVTDEKTVKELLCTVTCINCTFSGGGYTNATSGKVKAGTQITVNSNYTSRWYVNGSSVRRGFEGTFFPVEATSITRTINQNTTIQAEMVIN